MNVPPVPASCFGILRSQPQFHETIIGACGDEDTVSRLLDDIPTEPGAEETTLWGARSCRHQMQYQQA
jgi:hypothetical protein